MQIHLACASYPAPCSTGQAGAALSLTGTGAMKLSGPTASCAAGVAIFADRANTSPMAVTGTSAQVVTGGIYAKSAALTLTGTGTTSAFGGPIVVGSAVLTGTGSLSLTGALQQPNGLTATLAASPASPVVGATETLTAIVSCCGKPVAGQSVTFTVKGANPATGTATTNASGVATFTYVGKSAGTDTATASATTGGSVITSSAATIAWQKATPKLATTPTASVAVGGTVRDTATISGGYNPTGTVSWHLYRSTDTTCAAPLDSGWAPVALSSGSALSPAFTPAAAGTYQWVASYSGDAANVAVAGKCVDTTEQVVVVAKPKPSITTQASASVAIGGTIRDTATLSGGSSPTGTVSFNVYAGADTTCATKLNANVLTATLSGNTATSPAFAPAAPGTYRFIATYSGDANNQSVAGTCTDPNETVIVTKATPTITTQASAGIALGGKITDVATVAGGYSPSGSISWHVYAGADTTCATPLDQGLATSALAGGTATSPAFTPTKPGTYQWIATYGGDANNAPVAGRCGDPAEQVVVVKASPTLSTNASSAIVIGGTIRDTATLTGGQSPTGSISFNVYAASDATCATPLNASALTAALSGASATSPAYTPATAGTYRFIATYSGDANNQSVAGRCGDPNESVVVDRATPTITTQASASVSLGKPITDAATVAGGASPTGTVTWRLYAAQDTSCANPIDTQQQITATLSGGSANSPPYTPTVAGKYQWIATYSGDTNNKPVSGSCGDTAEQVTVTAVQGTCTDNYTGPDHGAWEDAANWSAGHTPTDQDVACVAAGTTVVVSTGSNRAGLLLDRGGLVVAGGSLDIGALRIEFPPTQPGGSPTVQPSTIADLELGEGTLRIAGIAHVTSTFSTRGSYSTSALAGTGRLVIDDSATAVANTGPAETLELDGLTLVNQGTFTSGRADDETRGHLEMRGGAHIENSGTFTIHAAQSWTLSDTYLFAVAATDGSAMAFTNSGRVTLAMPSAFDSAAIGVAFINSGTVGSIRGALEFAAGGSSSGGAWSAAAGAQVGFTGGAMSLTGDTVSGPGTLRVSGGSVTADRIDGPTGAVEVSGGSLALTAASTTTLGSLTTIAGRLVIDGELNVRDAFTSSGINYLPGPAIAGAGRLIVAPTATGRINSGGVCQALTLDGVTFVNRGDTLDGPADAPGLGVIAMRAGARLLNEGTLRLHAVQDCFDNVPSYHATIAAIDPATPAPSILNTGLITAALGTRAAVISVPFENRSTLTASTGRLGLTAGGSGASSVFSAEAGARLSFGGGAFALTNATLGGAGTVSFDGALVTVNGLHAANGTVLTTGGRLTTESAIASNIANLALAGGTVAADGELAITATLMSGGNYGESTLAGSGRITVGAGVRGTLNTGSCSRLHLDGVTLLNQGTLISRPDGDTPNGGIAMRGGAVLENAGTLMLSSAFRCGASDEDNNFSIHRESGGAAPAVINRGTIDLDQVAATKIDVAFVNDGTVNAQRGTVKFLGGGVPGRVGIGCWRAMEGEAVLDGGTFDVEDGGDYEVTELGATVNHHPSGLTGTIDNLPSLATGTVTLSGRASDANPGRHVAKATVQVARAGRDHWMTACSTTSIAADGSYHCDWDTTAAEVRDTDYDVRTALRDDCATCVKTAYTAVSHVRVSNYPLSISPRRAGPVGLGNTQKLTATLVKPDGTPIAGRMVHIEVTGANPGSFTGTTDDTGSAAFSYVGDHRGTDAVRAWTQPESGPRLDSNTAEVNWEKLLTPVSSTPVDGAFYAAPAGARRFTATPASTPAFGQTFPTINFNPSSGASGSPWFVDATTGPFTNVTTDQIGKVSGKTIAHGDGHVAGLYELHAFDAAFTANFVVSQPGDVTFKISSRDGFMLGLGGDATRVNGPFEGASLASASVFQGLPLVAAWNKVSTGSANHFFTVHFPAAGSYPYELDYFHGGGDELSLGLTIDKFQPDSATDPLSVYVGYSDGRRPAGSLFPFPWRGSPTVSNFIGLPLDATYEYDGGTVRFDNNSDVPITLDEVSVDVGPVSRNLWGHGITVAPHEITILAGTAYDNFDTSDFAPGACDDPASVKPEVHVTIGGATTTYVDDAQILNTGGIDVAACSADGNEALPWSRIGGGGDPIDVPLPSAVLLQVTPSVVTGHEVGEQQKLAVTARDLGGDAVAGLDVNLRVTGANPRTFHVTTGADGVAQATYTGAYAGKDTVSATAFISGMRAASNQLTVPWAVPQAPEGLLGDSPAGSTGASPPSITNLFPGGGTLVTATTPVTASIHANDPITDWRAVLTPAGGSDILLSEGTGTPPTVLGSIIPGELGEGTYRLAVKAETAGGSATVSANIVVGTKPGIPAPAPVSSGGGAPTIINLAPASNSVIGITVPVTARANVPSGEHVTRWTTTLQPRDGSGPEVTLGDSTDEQPQPLATIDPRKFFDGLYTLRVTARASGGGSTTVSRTLTLGLGAAQGAQIGGDDTGTSHPPTGGPGVGTTQSFAPPSVRLTSPSAGATVTAPSPITADVTPTPGDPIATWSVTLQGSRDGTARELVHGTGTPPSSLGTFDPTVLANDTYDLTLVVNSQHGAMQSTTVPVAVTGGLKPGRFTQSYTDISMPATGFTLSLGRTYDSYDKATGDFGVGWRQSLGGFTVATNGPLGAGGWSQYPDRCTFNACTYGYSSRPKHAVTVTWPDGHQEVFDFTPTGDTLNNLEVHPGFTARSGTATMSTLKALGSADIIYAFNGNLEDGADGSPWTATRFELTTKTGEVLILDADSGLVSETDRNGNSLTVDRDGIHSSSGRSIELTRDAAGRVTAADGPAGLHRSYGYSAAGDLTSVTDALGNTVRYEYDADHNLTKSIDPSGRPLRTVHYDSAGRISSITDALGNTVDLDVSADGRQQTTTSPDGRLTTITTSDDRGNPTRVDKIADGQTRTTRYEYDAYDNQTRVTDPLGHSTSQTFDANSNLTSSTDGVGNTTRYEYDASNELVKTTAPDGGATTLTRNDAGQVTKQSDPLGHETTFQYDAAGQETAQIDALGRVVRTAYDASGNAERVTDPSGTTMTSAYDGAGQVRSMSAPGLGTTQLQYDDEGELTAMIDALGHATRYSYDALGHRTGVTDQLGRSTVTDYDALGRRTKVTDREGAVSTFAYDEQGRLTSKVVGGAQTSYSYDGSGRVLSAANDDATVMTAYDAADHPVSFATQLAGSSSVDTVTYAYDAAGRRSSMAYGGVTDSYAYDDASRLLRLTSSQAGEFAYSYDAAGRRTGLARPNGVATSYAYNAADQVASIVHARGGATLDSSEYGYDAAGRRTLVSQHDGDHAYGYDAAGRVTSADNPSGLTDEAFSYDDLGNRTGAGELYDAANRMQSRTGFTYQSDREGRITQRTASNGDVTRFSWDAQDRLRTITLPDGSVTQLRYDPMGRRIATTRNGQTRVQVYGLDPNAVAESTGSASVRNTFGLGYDTPLAMTAAGASTYFEQDALSSVTSLSDQSGTVVGRYGYDTYGQITAHTGAESPYTYTGREYDAGSGLYDYRARWYEPAAGRFASEDPLPALNEYAYADDSPLVISDPSGATSLAEEDGVVSTEGSLARITYTTYRSRGLQKADFVLKLYAKLVRRSPSAPAMAARQAVQLLRKLLGLGALHIGVCSVTWFASEFDLIDPKCDVFGTGTAY